MLNPNLPPGFRFHPTDEELVIYYLKQKMASPSSPLVSIIPDIDLYKFNPWELPAKASFGGNEWFYFTPRYRKYPNGVRPNRAAGSGYWKATGTDKPILTSDGLQCLGVKKALVFYDGRPPKGVKSDWIMDEYRLLKDSRSFTGLQGSMRLDDWVLCRIRQKANNIPQKTVESQENCNNHIPLFTFQHSNPEDVANDIAAKTQVYDEAPKKIDEAVLDEKAQQFLGFNGGKFEPIELSDVKSNSPPRMVCHIKSTFKRMHLLESSDEFEETITAPIKRQCITGRHTASGTGIFQIPYLANWSASMLQSYSISPN